MQIGGDTHTSRDSWKPIRSAYKLRILFDDQKQKEGEIVGGGRGEKKTPLMRKSVKWALNAPEKEGRRGKPELN